MKKYRSLNEKKKRQHEEALQRYQEDHMDETDIITFTEGVTRRLGRFHSLKKHQSYSNQMNLKKYQGHQGLLMIQARKNRSLIKYQDQVIEKRLLQRQEKK